MADTDEQTTSEPEAETVETPATEEDTEEESSEEASETSED